MIRIFKYFLFAFLFLNLYSEVQSKPVPPGSGEGDVPANILFLIDSSASMSRRISNRDAVFGMTNAILWHTCAEQVYVRSPWSKLSKNYKKENFKVQKVDKKISGK